MFFEETLAVNGLMTSLKQRIAILIILPWFAMLPASVEAGGGPENVFLVVNRRSWASLTIANHFCQLRQISPYNVLYLDWDYSVLGTGIKKYRAEILTPVLDAIKRRKLTDQIDYIVYSSDFPYAVNYAADGAGQEKFPAGSLTGLTYLADLVQNKDTGYAQQNSNQYMRMRSDDPTIGFSRRYQWDARGQKVESGGRRYWLSTMLAYTSGRGNTISEAIRYLRRSALADGSQPKGTVYFMRNQDVRSTTRQPGFPLAIDRLRRAGLKGQVLEGNLPTAKNDILGAMIGRAGYDWNKSRSKILPGAICENLTSYGGIFKPGAGQTPLTECLRYGAAGSSGTVIEPYAIQAKFPHPMLYAHYARGSTLAEAFYQSVAGPYQLLIVGDPLCRPWAKIPQVTLGELDQRSQLRGVVTISPTVKNPSQRIKNYRLFVDGRMIEERPPGDSFKLDTRAWANGYHEIRVVATESSDIESQGRIVLPIMFANKSAKIEASVVPERTATFGQPISVAVKGDAFSYSIFHNRRFVGRVKGASGQTSIDTSKLGLGPIRLNVIGKLDTGKTVLARPIDIEVILPPPARGRATNVPSNRRAPGLLLKKVAGTAQTIPSTATSNWLSTAGVATGESFQLTGTFDVAESELHQLQIGFAGEFEVRIDGRRALTGRTRKLEYHHAPVVLERGTHQFSMTGKSRMAKPFLDVLFGAKVVRPLAEADFYHESKTPIAVPTSG